MLRVTVDMYSPSRAHSQPQIVLLLLTQKVDDIKKNYLYIDAKKQLVSMLTSKHYILFDEK
jgi:hypothetical protein